LVGVFGKPVTCVSVPAAWVDEPAFVDGNIVWGRVVADIPAFCRLLVQEFGKG